MDSGFVPSDDDTGEDRMYWRVKYCPCHEECSKNSWSKVSSWSYASLEQVVSNVKEHIVNSDLHKYRWSHDGDEAIDKKLDECDVEFLTETSDERARYRSQIKRVQSQPQKGKGKDGKDKDRDKDKRHAEVDRLKTEVKRLKTAIGDQGDSAARASASTAPIGAIVPHGQMAQAATGMNYAKVQLVKDSIDRAKHALAQSRRLLNQSAVAFQERAAACTAAATQLDEESDVMNAAKELLTELAAQMR